LKGRKEQRKIASTQWTWGIGAQHTNSYSTKAACSLENPHRSNLNQRKISTVMGNCRGCYGERNTEEMQDNLVL
jgi:hypothetical protein